MVQKKDSKPTKNASKKRQSSKTTRTIKLCDKKEIETGVWLEFPTQELWKRAKNNLQSVKVKLELRAVNDLKERKINLTVNHRPILTQALADPNRKNKFSAEIGRIINRDDIIRLKIEGNRYFKWETSLMLIVKESRRMAKGERKRGSKEAPSQGTRFCFHCGSLLLVNARFCHRCGTRIVSEAALEEAQEAQPTG
jgi:hypothetical protein